MSWNLKWDLEKHFLTRLNIDFVFPADIHNNNITVCWLPLSLCLSRCAFSPRFMDEIFFSDGIKDNLLSSFLFIFFYFLTGGISSVQPTGRLLGSYPRVHAGLLGRLRPFHSTSIYPGFVLFPKYYIVDELIHTCFGVFTMFSFMLLAISIRLFFCIYFGLGFFHFLSWMFINHRSTMWRTEPIRRHAGSYRRHQSVPGTVQRFPQNHRHPIDQRDEMSVHTAHTAETITVNKQGCLSWEQENARQTLPREYTEKTQEDSLFSLSFFGKIWLHYL